MSTDEDRSQLGIEAAGPRSIAAQHIGNAFTGDVLPAKALHAPSKVTAAPGTSNLPPITLCLGREEELDWLRRTLTSRHEGAITQSGTVHGLGGIGKTTLALYYAHRHRADYTLIWWINAASPDEIETSLTGLTHTLVPDWATTAGREAQVAWARQWLAWHPGWLLIHDNVENPDDLTPYTGALHQGHHLATSRRTTGWSDSAPTLTLGNLDPDDATALLCRLVFKETSPTPRQGAEARSLATELGHFPLAIKQAGAYLAQNRGISMDSYRRRLDTKLAKTAHGTDTERTLARIWNVTLDALELADPLAVEVLHTAAWLAPDDIPYSLLTPIGIDSDDVAEAVGILAAYSMVTDTGTALSVHRLVQAVLRTPQNSDGIQSAQRLQGRDRAEQAVLRSLTPMSGQGTPAEDQWDVLTPHLVALAATRPSGLHNIPLVDVYEATAKRLHQQGHTARATSLLEAVLAHCEQSLGNAHPGTLNRRNNVASAYQAAGDLRRAIPLMEAVLVQREQLLGDIHPDTLTSRNNLGSAYQDAGDLRRAIPLLEIALAQCEQVLGDTHPDTLTSRNNLATAYQAAGDLNRAIHVLEAALAQCEQLLGDIHPDTLTSRNNLANAYQAAGDLRRAIPLLEIALAQRKQVLGDTHPDTLTSRNNLASAYYAAGDLRRAIPLYQATLAQREQIMGDTHPNTSTSRNNLASAYQAAGDLDRAIPLLEIALAQREQTFGDTHPNTLSSRNNLAGAYQAAGDLDRALPLLETVLAQCEQTLGHTHPNTLAGRNNLAGAYQAAGDLDRALPLLETVLAQCEQTLGHTHPSTLTSRNNLANAYREAGDLDRALPLLKTVLAQFEQTLGDTHPSTLTSRSSLGNAYREAGDLDRALPLLTTVLAQRKQALGDTHPSTLTSRNSLAKARQQAEAVQHGSTATSVTEAVPQEPSTAD